MSFTDLWIAVYSEVFEYVDVDLVQIWEDISYGSGSMVSHALIKEFMLLYYKKFTSFLRGGGIKNVFVDTDGDCHDLIPLFLEVWKVVQPACILLKRMPAWILSR